MEKKKLSIIVTVFKSEESLRESFYRIIALRDAVVHMELEFIFVIDGSPDDSLGLLLKYKETYPFIKIVNFTRNCGPVNAFLAGLDRATGDCATVLPSDMQDPPELIAQMVGDWEAGYKAVYAVRKNRKDPLSSRIFSKLYYHLLRKIAIPDYPKTGFDVFLIDRQVMDEVRQTKEKNCHIQNTIYMMGFNHKEIYYDREERKQGKSSWTFSKKLKFFIDSFVSYSYAPIRFMTVVGFLVAMASFALGMYILVMTLFVGSLEPGWPSIMVIVTFLMGTMMMMMGILGEYLWRVLDEVRPRRPYIVDEFYD